MNVDGLGDVWALLDRAELERLVRTGPEPMFASISGAHLYGFASADSDVDLRGAFVLPACDILGLQDPKETLELVDERAGVELDWVAHDIRKFARMMTQANGYVLEQLYSPLVVIGGREHEELREIGRGCVTRRLLRHYAGFARGRRKRLAEPNPTVKHLLYAYRVYFTGIHALRSGEIEANLVELNEDYGSQTVQELAARKRSGEEVQVLKPSEVEAHLPQLEQLEARLSAAHAESTLSQEPTTLAALEDFVIRTRLARIER